jgi:hypothetical protein
VNQLSEVEGIFADYLRGYADRASIELLAS